MGRSRSERIANETLLGVTLQRALGAIEKADVAAGRDPSVPATAREKFRALFKASHTASRVASLVVMWATALVDLERDAIGVEEYAEWAAEGRTTVYRHLAEFRTCWPEYDTPNEVARLLIAQANGRKLSPSMPVAIA